MFEDFKNAFSRVNNGHVQLIIINVAVFLLLEVVRVALSWSNHPDIFSDIYKNFSIPDAFADFTRRPWTLITYSFTHDLNQIWHILFNMLVLYWFGKLFVEYLGSDKLIALYVLGAITGALIYLGAYNLIPNPPEFITKSSGGGMVGASGAIYAIMVGAATLLPDYTFFLLFLGPVRIKYIAAFYIIISFIGTAGANAGGNLAHLGGALMGYVYIKQLQAGINWGRWITTVLGWFRNLFTARPKVKITYRKQGTQKAGTAASKATQEEIDTILDKISDRGYESLTKDEKEKLFNASKK
ncbi:MAG: rhomboid family intramembrane serine protease [Bacteroidetes bacterium]|nr:rhomboid family intramembrane serine protease [Bacteroidota bacterium]MBS1540990.1 rhomboid family intramembrane serine protease [Bacteroidota bacterium]